MNKSENISRKQLHESIYFSMRQIMTHKRLPEESNLMKLKKKKKKIKTKTKTKNITFMIKFNSLKSEIHA